MAGPRLPVLDMPPGTGDIQLTGAEHSGDRRGGGHHAAGHRADRRQKGIVMFEKVEVPVLGIVENMSMHICSNCGHHEPIFGTGGAQNWPRNTTPSCWPAAAAYYAAGRSG